MSKGANLSCGTTNPVAGCQGAAIALSREASASCELSPLRLGKNNTQQATSQREARNLITPAREPDKIVPRSWSIGISRCRCGRSVAKMVSTSETHLTELMLDSMLQKFFFQKQTTTTSRKETKQNKKTGRIV